MSILKMLTDCGFDARLYEKEKTLGGLIRCKYSNGHLYHLLGGHVFNSTNPAVKLWLEQKIPSYKSSLIQAKRKADILFDFGYIQYPIENYIYQLPKEIGKTIISDIVSLSEFKDHETLGGFLENTFGNTLYKLYFEPYNKKVWGANFADIPLKWLEGKLPMPNKDEIFASNIFREEESKMVHSTFFYPIKSGSQFWIDELSKNCAVVCGTKIERLQKMNNGNWLLNDEDEEFTDIVFTGDITTLDRLLAGSKGIRVIPHLKTLRSRGITNALCITNQRDSSWTYLPSDKLNCNRIINTGSFSPNNNAPNENSSVLEFPLNTPVNAIVSDLGALFPDGKLLETNSVEKAYIIQDSDTRNNVNEQRNILFQHNIHLLGRFAEWEYYNIDKCIEAAMKVFEKISGRPLLC